MRADDDALQQPRRPECRVRHCGQSTAAARDAALSSDPEDEPDRDLTSDAMSDSDGTASPLLSCEQYPVTKDWLENVLTEYHGAGAQVAVDEFRLQPFAGESSLSDILAVVVDYRTQPGDVRRELNVIVKLLPHDPFNRYVVIEAEFDLREIKFYTQVVPDLKAFRKKHLGASEPDLPIPECIYAHYRPGGRSENSPELPESFLVLENLRPQGYEGAEFSRGLTLRQAEAALTALGCMHAHSLALKVKEGFSLPERYPFLFQTARATDSYQHLVEREMPQLTRFLERKPGLEGVVEALLALRPRTKEVIATLLAPEEPLALVTHTDFWCNNLLFKTEEDGTCKCAIVDWQMVTFSRPTNDIALLMVTSLPTELRRRHTQSLLDKYWEGLTSATAKLDLDVTKELKYCRADLDRDYRRSQLLAILLCVGSLDMALGNPITEQRFIEALEDLYNDGVLTASAAEVEAKG